MLLQDILHAAVTKLKNSVLDDSLLGVNRVEEIDELHYIILVSQHVQDLELPRDDVPGFLCPLESNFALPIFIVGLEDVT